MMFRAMPNPSRPLAEHGGVLRAALKGDGDEQHGGADDQSITTPETVAICGTEREGHQLPDILDGVETECVVSGFRGSIPAHTLPAGCWRVGGGEKLLFFFVLQAELRGSRMIE